MISQNNTPQLLLPILGRFDRAIWYGEYIMLIAEKQWQKDIPAPQDLMHLQA
jgi:hypothetical protein